MHGILMTFVNSGSEALKEVYHCTASIYRLLTVPYSCCKTEHAMRESSALLSRVVSMPAVSQLLHTLEHFLSPPAAAAVP